MSQEKYIEMDVHQATISATVMDVQGKLLIGGSLYGLAGARPAWAACPYRKLDLEKNG